MGRRATRRLSAIGIRSLTTAGRYNDGDGLHLVVRASGLRSWTFRYRDRRDGRLRDLGLGGVDGAGKVSLAEARELADRARKQLREGIDPIDHRATEREVRRKELEATAVAQARRATFGDCCDRYIEAHRAGWRNAKHAAQWTNTLETYAAALKPLPVAEVDTGMVLTMLEPIWSTKTETATRVRQRVEAVLDWAKVRGHRQGDNPARWRGHLDKLLPKPNKIRRVEHHAALPHAGIAVFMVELRARSGMAARALELQILTATRPSEVVGARWPEIDLETATWAIPGERMKAGREHRVPLSPAALKLLKTLPRTGGDQVFPGGVVDRPVTIAATLQLAKELRPGITSHGFRSTFRDWASELTNHPREVAEMALAHTIGDKVEAAYRRGDLFARRRKIMVDWAGYCARAPKIGNVVELRESKA
ncbi:MAG: tyrosine-type recombinase/integrase [Lysobacter sp.]